MSFRVGVDIGGTFTDAIVVDPGGALTVAKVSTTPDDFSRGFFGAIAAAAEKLGLSEGELLRRTRALSHGTTVGINALVTGDVARVALLATRGHGDSIRIMAGGGRIRGASLEELLDYRLSSRPDPILPSERVYELNERVDASGEIVVGLSEAEVDATLEAFEDLQIGAVAIAYLWGFLNPVHELRTRDRIRAQRPDLFVSCSHEVAPRVGEYPRSISTVMNAQLGPLMVGYIERIVVGARERGFAGDALFGQVEGGLLPAAEAARFPLLTLQSGPVAGVVGAARAGVRMGFRDVIVTDMGGTTLDVSSIEGGEVSYRHEAEVVRQQLHLRKVDVESIGAGGGSIAWIHEDSRSLRVGPRSAGALPGPICYGRGGREVTVTDADLVLGVLDPERPLAGGLKLDRDAALRGVEALGKGLDLSPWDCASGVVEIVDSRMEDLIRRVTVQRGADPRGFVLWAYGGASGAHAGLFGRDIGVEEVVFPLNDTASVWSAYGLNLLDHSRTFEKSLALRTPLDLARLAEALDALTTAATTHAEQYGLSDYELIRRAGMKYPLQVHEVEVRLPPAKADELDEVWAAALVSEFQRSYEARFGAGTAYAQAGAELTTLRLSVRAAAPPPMLAEASLEPRRAAPSGERDVYWREFAEGSNFSPHATPIYAGAAFGPGTEIEGPGIVEYPHTSIAVRPGQGLRVDGFGNPILVLGGSGPAGEAR